MKFIIATAELGQILTKIQNVIAQKATIPILSNVLLEARGQELIVTATDLTVGIRCFTPAKVIEEGTTTLPARKLTQLIREITVPQIEITTNAQEITEIKANTSRFKLHGMNQKEFPSFPDTAGSTHFKMKQSDLKEMFFCTSFAVSREDSRYVLTGVFLQISDGIATFVGTDGKRLAKTKLPLSLDPSIKGDYIVPLKAVEEILKNLNDDEDATIFLMHDKIAVEANRSIIVTKLLSGEYPDVNRVIPAAPDINVTLHREELISLLRQVSLFTTDASQSVRFTFEPGELSLSANAMEIGEGKVSMPVNYQGQKLDIAFNPSYFLDVLRHSKEETLEMGLIDGFNPGVLTERRAPKPEEIVKPSPLFVVMPMRLNDE